MDQREIKRFSDVDVLVVGPTLHGVAAALLCARGGKRVALVMDTTSPAIEIGSTMAAWISDTELARLPDDLRGALLTGADTSVVCGDQQVSLIHQTQAIVAVEDMLLDAGVELYYGAYPIGLMVEGNGSKHHASAGALFGGKFGVSACTSVVVVDCTSDGHLTRASVRNHWQSKTNDTKYAACFLTNTSNWHDEIEYAPGITVAQRGSIAEFRFEISADFPDLYLRRKIISAQSAWNKRHPDISFHIERAGDVMLNEPGQRILSCGYAGPDTTEIRGFFCIGPIAAAEKAALSYLDNRTCFVPLVEKIIPDILQVEKQESSSPYSTLLQKSPPPGEVNRSDFGYLPVDSLNLNDPVFDEPDADTIVLAMEPIPVVMRSDVAVVGGGTSGAQAAIRAGLLGISTICVEAHADIGGVSTIGGVPAYWYGRRTPFFKRLHAQLKSTVREKELPVSLALLSMVDAAGTDLLLRTPTVGVAVEEGVVSHIVCATNNGLVALKSKLFIDASGDGDVAAWAGVPYTYGAERDEITLWCSFGTFHHGRDQASRQYMSVVDPRSICDTSRGIIAGRRMGGIFGQGRYIQHYLALRESRHIKGVQTVTYHDVMMERAFPDAVMYFKSNVDIKGVAASRAALCGYIERSFHQNYEASIPYGALTPIGIDNVLVVGKAYSITHDGISMARMQPDLMSLGTVAAIASKLAVGTGSFSEVDIEALQAELFSCEILLPGDLPNGRDCFPE